MKIVSTELDKLKKKCRKVEIEIPFPKSFIHDSAPCATPQYLIELCNSLLEKGIENIRWDIEYADGFFDVTQKCTRLETDEEYNNRLQETLKRELLYKKSSKQKAKEQRAYRKELEYQQYLKLKEKYGKDVCVGS
jgi:hypothetical protein